MILIIAFLAVWNLVLHYFIYNILNNIETICEVIGVLK